MGVLGAFLVEVALITYRGLRGVKPGTHPTSPIGLPLPANYTGAIFIYGVLGLATRTEAARVATLVGWGFVVATALDLWTPKKPVSLGKKPAAPAPVRTGSKGS